MKQHFVARIGDTVQVRLMSQDNVTLDAARPGGSAFGDFAPECPVNSDRQESSVDSVGHAVRGK